MGSSSKGGGRDSKRASRSADTLSKIALDLYNQSSPVRQGLLDRSNAFLAGNLDVTASPLFGSVKDAIQSQFARAKENVLANTASGGALTSALSDLESNKASSMASAMGGLASDELSRAYGLATGGAQMSQSGLASAGGIQSQLAANQAQVQAAGKQAAGEGIGRGAAAIIGKG